MDTTIENCMTVHLTNGETRKFCPSNKGLYKYDLKPSKSLDSFWTLVNTVRGQADKYTRCAYKRAMDARKLQNIIMRPNTQRFMDTCIQHLGSPITKQDIQIAEDIFGPNIGSLKGKTVRRPNKHIDTSTEPVPREILRDHRNVTICDRYYVCT